MFRWTANTGEYTGLGVPMQLREVRRVALRHVEVDPDRLSGRPTIRGTRVPAELVAQISPTPEGRKTLKSDYGVTERQTQDAQRWWHAVEDMAKVP